MREHSLYIKGNTHKMSRKANNPYKKCDPWEKEKQIWDNANYTHKASVRKGINTWINAHNKMVKKTSYKL